MKIKVNGRPRDVPEGASLLGLLESLQLSPQATIVERNGNVLSRDDYGNVIMADGDALELVRFVGGG